MPSPPTKTKKTPGGVGCVIRTSDYGRFLKAVPPGTVDLILTDPPYNISRKTGFSGGGGVARFATVSMDFGAWDHQEINLSTLAKNAYRAVRKGGTVIIFYDIWKLSRVAEAMTTAGFVQLRFIEWLKTNPVPLNSQRNYLTNSREIAVVGVKTSKPTFNSVYDNGLYQYPIPRGVRLHPTQKPLKLFVDLVAKHSNPGDLVVDPFIGSGTTAVAALQQGRTFAGCDTDKGYAKTARKRVRGMNL